MAQAEAGTNGPATPKNADLGVCRIAGRIVSRRGYKTRDGARHFTHIVKTPAPDQFTAPGTLEVHSPLALGDIGDDISCRVRVSGYGRSYKVTDADTGEARTVQTADIRLTVVE